MFSVCHWGDNEKGLRYHLRTMDSLTKESDEMLNAIRRPINAQANYSVSKPVVGYFSGQ
jgi:hypothetical protein